MERVEGIGPSYIRWQRTALPLCYTRLFGAGEGNRTLILSLEGWYITIMLHPHGARPRFFTDKPWTVRHLVVLRGIEPPQTLGFNQVLCQLSYSTNSGSPTRSRTENLSRLKGTPLPVGLQDQLRLRNYITKSFKQIFLSFTNSFPQPLITNRQPLQLP